MTYRWVRWEERPGHSVEVGEGELDAGVGEPQLVYVGGGVSGADITLAGERGDRDGVFQLVLREVVRDSSIHVSLRETHQGQNQLRSLDFPENGSNTGDITSRMETRLFLLELLTI